MTQPKLSRKKNTFTVEVPQAKSVSLMGDFNNWDHSKHPMKNQGNGVWQKTVMLYPGTYEYKFFVDGCWLEELHDSDSCRNCFGTNNSVLNLDK